jgi:hypothetical protein
MTRNAHFQAVLAYLGFRLGLPSKPFIPAQMRPLVLLEICLYKRIDPLVVTVF